MEQAISYENRIKLDELNHSVYKIRAEVAKVIVGQEQPFDLMLTASCWQMGISSSKGCPE